VGNSVAVLLQIYFSICLPKTIKVIAKIEKCKNFFASQCIIFSYMKLIVDYVDYT